MTVVYSTTYDKACVEAEERDRHDILTHSSSSLRLIGSFNDPLNKFIDKLKCHTIHLEKSKSLERGLSSVLLPQRQDHEEQCARSKLHDSARSINYASPFSSVSCVSDLVDAGKGSSSIVAISSDAKSWVNMCTEDPIDRKLADDALEPHTPALYIKDFSLDVPLLVIVISAIVILSNIITSIASPASSILVYVALGSVLPTFFTTAEDPNLPLHRHGSISTYSVIASILSYITIGIFLHGACLDADLDAEVTNAGMLMHAMHAIAARPALYTTGLPQDSFSLPQTVPGQQWLLSMYFIAILGFILPFTWLKRMIAAAGTTPVGPSHQTSPSSFSINQLPKGSVVVISQRMTPAMFPYVAICASSGAWIALATIACWVA